MLLNIVLEDTTKDNHEAMMEVANKIHESLHGNKDYVDCNIVLNVSDEPTGGSCDKKPECTLYISGNDVTDKELIRQKAKEAIDIFVDSLDK